MAQEIHIYVRKSAAALARMSALDWASFENGSQPIESPFVDHVEFLLLTIQDGICELAEPLSVSVDSSGFVQRHELKIRTLDTSSTSLVDGRDRFVRRYVRHAHQWQLHPSTLAEACRLSGIETVAQEG